MNRERMAAAAGGLIERYGLRDRFFLRFFGAFFIVSAAETVRLRLKEISPISAWKDAAEQTNLAVNIIWIIIVMLLLSILYRILPKKMRYTDHVALAVGATAFGLCSVWRTGSYYQALGIAAACAMFTVYALGKISDKLDKIPAKISLIIVISAALFMTWFISYTSIAKHRAFGTSCFDMGIFLQMFNSLKENFSAVTTCERAAAMSHFNVHASYIFYLILPIYYIFPSASTLMIIQAVMSMGGVLPLYKIAQKRDFKGFALISICLVYIFCAGLVMPCYYSFHENALLPTLLMWVLYAAEFRNIPLLYIMSILTLTVKEDAALYIICIALFLVFDKKMCLKKHGFTLVGISTVYFMLIIHLLNKNGDGVYMTNTRLGILMTTPGSGMINVLKNVLSDPAYFFSLFVTENSLLFIVQTLGVLLFIPVLTKKLHRILLIIPYIIMCLVIGSGYHYAANIDFQYIFGPSCLLIYLVVINIDGLSHDKRALLTAAMAIIAIITTSTMASVKLSYVKDFNENKDFYLQADAVIDSVPKDGAVLANTFLLPHAADRDELYELSDDVLVDLPDGRRLLKCPEDYDFCILSHRDPLTPDILSQLDEAGWQTFADSDFVIVYSKDVAQSYTQNSQKYP